MAQRGDGTVDEPGLSRAELAERAGATGSDIDRLVTAGVVRPRPDGSFPPGDVHRLRIVAAFERTGVPLDALAEAARAGTISLEYYDELHPGSGPLSSRTFGQLKADVGPDDAHLLERLLTALGLAAPAGAGRLEAADESLLLEVLAVLASIDDPEHGLRVARLYGEGARRASEAALNVYALAVEEVRREAAGLPSGDVYARFLRPWSRIARLAPRLAAWLNARHLSAAIEAYSVAATEDVLAQAGFVPEREAAPPAVAFVDLTGFTRLADERGDDVAAGIAMRLGALAEEVAQGSSGRVVKLLGDGVLLRFESVTSAVEAALDLLERLHRDGLPSGHVGIEAGPLVAREGDIFGRTVNLAARLADRAGPGEVIMTDAAAADLPPERFVCEPLGARQLKGIKAPVEVVRVSRPGGAPTPGR